jgi:hypothetical protein
MKLIDPIKFFGAAFHSNAAHEVTSHVIGELTDRRWNVSPALSKWKVEGLRSL